MGELKKTQYKILGMHKDNSESSFEPKFSFDNKNIRITSLTDNSQLNIVNERGPKLINILNKTKDFFTDKHFIPDTTNLEIRGTPIGYNIIDNELILFTTENSDMPVVKIINNVLLNIKSLSGNVRGNIFTLNYILNPISNVTTNIIDNLKFKVYINLVYESEPNSEEHIKPIVIESIGKLTDILTYTITDNVSDKKCRFLIINKIEILYNTQLLFKGVIGKVYETIQLNRTLPALFKTVDDLAVLTNLNFPSYTTLLETIENSSPVIYSTELLRLTVINGNIINKPVLNTISNYIFKNTFPYLTDYRYYYFDTDSETLKYLEEYPDLIQKMPFGLIYFYKTDDYIIPPGNNKVESIIITDFPETIIAGESYLFTVNVLPNNVENKIIDVLSIDPIITVRVVEFNTSETSTVLLHVNSSVPDNQGEPKSYDISISSAQDPEISVNKTFIVNNPVLELNLYNTKFKANGDLYDNKQDTFRVISNVDYEIKISPDNNWITTSLSDNEYTIYVTPNLLGVERVGQIEVTKTNNSVVTPSSRFITITQESAIVVTSIFLEDFVRQLVVGTQYKFTATAFPIEAVNRKLLFELIFPNEQEIIDMEVLFDTTTQTYTVTLLATEKYENKQQPIILKITSEENPECAEILTLNIKTGELEAYTDYTINPTSIQFLVFGGVKAPYSDILHINNTIPCKISCNKDWIKAEPDLLNTFLNPGSKSLTISTLPNETQFYRTGIINISPTNRTLNLEDINIYISQEGRSLVAIENILFNDFPTSIIENQLYRFTAQAAPNEVENKHLIFSTFTEREDSCIQIVSRELDLITMIYTLVIKAIKIPVQFTGLSNNSFLNIKSSEGSFDNNYQISINPIITTFKTKSNIFPRKIIFTKSGTLLDNYSNIIEIFSNLPYRITLPNNDLWVTANPNLLNSIQQPTQESLFMGIDVQPNDSIYMRSTNIMLTPITDDKNNRTELITIMQEGILLQELPKADSIVFSDTFTPNLVTNSEVDFEVYASPSNILDKTLNFKMEFSIVENSFDDKPIDFTVTFNPSTGVYLVKFIVHREPIYYQGIDNSIYFTVTSNSNPLVEEKYTLNVKSPYLSLSNTNIKFNSAGTLTSPSDLIIISSNVKFKAIKESLSDWVYSDPNIFNKLFNNEEVFSNITVDTNTSVYSREVYIFVSSMGDYGDDTPESKIIKITQEGVDITNPTEINSVNVTGIPTEDYLLLGSTYNVVVSYLPTDATETHLNFDIDNQDFIKIKNITHNRDDHSYNITITSDINAVLPTEEVPKCTFFIKNASNTLLYDVTKNIINPILTATVKGYESTIMEFDVDGNLKNPEQSSNTIYIVCNTKYKIYIPTTDSEWLITDPKINLEEEYSNLPEDYSFNVDINVISNTTGIFRKLEIIIYLIEGGIYKTITITQDGK